MDDPAEAPSPSPQLDEPLPPLPSLPIEILQRIIQLTLPRLSFDTFRPRYDVLLTCCRVNKLWAAIAREELWRHVGLRSRTGGDSFLQATEHAHPTSTRSIRLLITSLGGDSSEPNRLQVSQMESMLRAFPELKVLQFVAENGPEPVADLGAISAHAQGLHDLTLDYCVFTPSPQLSPLCGRLRRLTLSFLTGDEIASILTSADLPLLRDLITLLHSNPSDARKLTAAFSRYGAQLTAFTLSFVDEHAVCQVPAEVWSTFTALRALTLDHSFPLETILPLLPAPLHRLRVRWSFRPMSTSLRQLNRALQASPKCVNTLKYLNVPELEQDEPEEDEGEEEHAARCSIAEFCQSRGIEMVERSPFAFKQSLEYLEDAIEPW